MTRRTSGKRLRVLVLEPYHGGSHRAFLQGLRRHSRHDIHVRGLPARKWKWRMRHAAVEFARRLSRRTAVPDVILASDFLNVAEFAGMLPPRWQRVPRVVYFHENQLTYPVPDETERDYQYAFTHLTSILASRAAYFNSRYHLDEFFTAMEALLRRMPDFRPLGELRRAHRLSRVLHLGCDLGPLLGQPVRRAGSATLLWTHRWETDKDPQTFLRLVGRLAGEGLDFRLILMGEHFERIAPDLKRQVAALKGRILHAGFVAGRTEYRRLLSRSDVVVSTARHEFFGVGVVEAVAAGAWPLLPARLAYPEILPRRLHAAHLWRTEAEFVHKLRTAIQGVESVRAADLRRAVARFDWPRAVGRYDRALEQAAASCP